MILAESTGRVNPWIKKVSSTSLLQDRRDSAIKIRETLWRSRQQELIMEKKQAWEMKKLELQGRILEAKDRKKRKTASDRIVRKHIEVEEAYKDRCRNLAIKSKERKREALQTKKILEKIDDYKASVIEQDAHRKKIKCRKVIEEREGKRVEHIEKTELERLNARREEIIRLREQARGERAVMSSRNDENKPCVHAKVKILQSYNPCRSVFAQTALRINRNEELEAKREANIVEREARRKQDLLQRLASDIEAAPSCDV